MLVEAILNICKYMNSFYSSKRDNIVYYILTIQLLRDTKKMFNSGTYRNTK